MWTEVVTRGVCYGRKQVYNRMTCTVSRQRDWRSDSLSVEWDVAEIGRDGVSWIRLLGLFGCRGDGKFRVDDRASIVENGTQCSGATTPVSTRFTFTAYGPN